MRSLIAFSFLLCVVASASEPSVFGAGDLNHPNPYGLTNEEKLILENKKEIQAVLQKNNTQNAKVETVTERLDGLQTIVEGLAQASNENKIALQKLTQSSADDNTTTSIDEIKKSVDANTANIAQFKGLLEELTQLVDEINGNYVTKEQFSALIKELKVKVPTSSTVDPAKMDKADLEKAANKLFSQKKYADAQSYFEQMVQRKYKVPEAYFMIGETQFERKAYKEAVYYYKESASRNEKAGYMPTLLLHSGISMEKTGDTATAKAFFQATISKFGSSGAAKEAQEHLAKLK
ncbi:MAG: tetratricopeptide repeat protein [Sulfuricurvum sp.]|uniref:tetratricopeptide repeat protein n=1 Tax=Sulfuricurvum sp. TaxID=2025608 RepID=UPI003566020C